MGGKRIAPTRGTVARRSLWQCPKCGRPFANTNQSHACGPLDLERHFTGRSPAVRELFEQFERRVRSIGPVIVLPEKTRIAFQVRMSFAQVTPRSNWLTGHLVLARRRDAPCVRRVEPLTLRCYVHHFRLDSEADMDERFMSMLREAYAVGEQRAGPSH